MNHLILFLESDFFPVRSRQEPQESLKKLVTQKLYMVKL